ncbi:MAG: sodium:calcium symporter, partial [Thermoanaerobaculia bacterium]
LSVGMGSIQTYASYLRKKDDVALTGLSTASTNEFAEVVLGGTIAIPAAVVFFGVAGATAIANRGSYDLGIVAMGVVFQGLPGPQILGQLAAFLWFFLLFIAGVTSCVALASPTIAFLQEEIGLTRRNAARSVAGLGLLLGLFHVVFYQKGVLDEWDYWAGTFGLVVFATIEIILFSFVFGIDRGWDELHEGADIKIPRIYKPIMKWVTPLFLITLLTWWTVTEAIPNVLMQGVTDAGNIPYLWLARILMIALVVVGAILIRRSWVHKTTNS